MSRHPALLILCLLIGAAPAMAQLPIHRCVGANGGPVFTDRPCATLNATPVEANRNPAPVSELAKPPAVLCAADMAELRQSVIDAFASHDANRLAALMLWRGYGRGAAIADIRSLHTLMKQPLLDINSTPDETHPTNDPAPALDDPFGPDMPASAPPPRPPNQLVLHTADNDGTGAPRELRFDIIRSAGCLWLRSAD